MIILKCDSIRRGVVVGALNSGSGVGGPSTGRGTAPGCWVRRFTFTVPLFTQVYKWVTGEFTVGGLEILSTTSWNLDKFRPDGPLGRNADFFTPHYKNAGYILLTKTHPVHQWLASLFTPHDVMGL